MTVALEFSVTFVNTQTLTINPNIIRKLTVAGRRLPSGGLSNSSHNALTSGLDDSAAADDAATAVRRRFFPLAPRRDVVEEEEDADDDADDDAELVDAPALLCLAGADGGAVGGARIFLAALLRSFLIRLWLGIVAEISAEDKSGLQTSSG